MTEPGERRFEPAHQTLREQLGSYALGHLDPASAQAVRAHLDGCAECRAEAADLASLRGMLSAVDPSHFGDPPTPPPDLGSRIRAAIADERGQRDARRVEDELERARNGRLRRRLRVAAVAAALVAGASGGALVERLVRADPVRPPSVAMEPVALKPVAHSGVRIDSANLVAHSWGVELRMQGAGFAAGEVYLAAFRARDGRLVPAGEFIGTGAAEVTCNLQSGVLREQTVGVVIMDDAGDPVARTN